jgi:hypothetical protein
VQTAIIVAGIKKYLIFGTCLFACNQGIQLLLKIKLSGGQHANS